jgi:MFS family permease
MPAIAKQFHLSSSESTFVALSVGLIGYAAGSIIIGGLALANEAVLIIGSFLASLAFGLYLQVAYTYTAESFPTRARASGFSLSDGIGHGGGALGALVLPTVVASVSFFAGFVGIGITGALAGLIALLGPRSSPPTTTGGWPIRARTSSTPWMTAPIASPMVGWPGGISLGSHRSRRDSLPSPGSSYPFHQKLRVHCQCGKSTGY